MARLNNLIIENARIMFRNFSGKEGRFNPEGQRNFCVAIDDPEAVEQMKTEGYNIKYLTPRDEEEEPQPYIQVKVRFDNYPPKVVLVTNHGKSILDAETVSTLDYAEITNADLIISPNRWEMGGKTGVSAYLKSLYITIAEDPFEAKYYGNLPDSAYDAIGGCGHCDECDGHCKDNKLPF